MAFKSEIHVAELASIRTGHAEGDIYYILDNGMLGDLPCKPGTFVKWHNDTWQIQSNEHYALASAVDGDIAQAIDNILDDGQASETVVVAVPSSQSGDYTVGNYYEVQGKVARLRTKTDGDNVTQLTFDTTSGVLDAMNGIISGGDSTPVVMLEGVYSQLNPTDVSGLPDAQSVRDAADSGKIVILHLTTPPSPGPAVHCYYWLVSNETYVLHFLDLHRSISDEERYLDLRTSDNAWLVNTYGPRIPAQLFVEPPVFGGNLVPHGSGTLMLRNISDCFSLVLIGLTANDGSYVSAGDIFELVTNSFAAFGNSNLLSMGLFKMVGHPTLGSSGPVTFRRLTASLPPRSIAGVRNDGGVPPYGQEPVAANPIRFTLDQSAQFDKGELLYLGIAVAYDSAQESDSPVFICSAPELPVQDYNNPINVVGPVYYALGQSDTIGADGFTAREFTIGYSDTDFSLATTFTAGNNAYVVSTNGVSETRAKTYPSGFKLLKQ